ncbi:hypothetical protein [Amphiplicatus metriothermophilus]|uniref:Uncharacterized protein n=1 Tax=Amphiplicatus metriothermophilus TaxID=1519374 RepID=A0A239PP21_9PROT|nr:hypothetical protein [Amphiplicatus metriothermophilus]MBB5518794.1 hypothetical protein [Amphiplicatus metriothermophilus]SNT72051.1 hypothetical protein SAMN06297382_1077 [Amphiplicatus metriothermophilus]
MGTGYGFGGEEIKEESSWRYPLAIFVATLILCAIFLYYYVGPSVDEFSGNVPSPAISEEPVSFTVGGVAFSAPANYTVYPRDRRGGERDEVALYALWPTLAGYAPARRSDFLENAPDTRRIDILIAERTSVFNEAERVEELYLPQTTDRRGARTPYQLVKYAFRDQRVNVPTSGYANTELYLGETEEGELIALFCFSETADLPSPECWREYELGDKVAVSYRFKRPYLPEWRAIDARVRAFVRAMMKDDGR